MRSLISVLMILWLPLQGFAAVAMPFCEHAMHRAPAGMDAGANAHQHHAVHQSHALAGDASDQHGHSGTALDCKDCGACHLACTPAAPAHAPAVHLDASYAYSERAPALAPLFIPDQPHHPPLFAHA